MKKVISFSLWGEDPKYCVGAIRNADIAPIYYPDWICRFHVGKSVPSQYVEALQNMKNTEVVIRETEGDWTGMFWRFEDASDPSVDVMISRDTDSRLNAREAAAVSEWLATDKAFHIMRDHPYHATEILGGMWGVKNPFLSEMAQMIQAYKKGNFWQVDQNFLREKIWPLVNRSYISHDDFFEKHPWPLEREPNRFVGQAFEADDTMSVPEHARMI